MSMIGLNRFVAVAIAVSVGVMTSACGKDGGTTGAGEPTAGAGEPTAKAAPESPLASAATGSWEGWFGKATFAGDGTGTVAWHNCGYSTPAPGVAELPDIPARCGTMKASGTVEIKGQIMNVGGHNLGAYQDKDGNLHLGYGEAGRLDGDKRGTVPIDGFEVLTVGPDKCSSFDRFKDERADVPCRFEEQDGRQLLFYKPSGADEEKVLVYLPEAHVLVAAQLIPMVFERPCKADDSACVAARKAAADKKCAALDGCKEDGRCTFADWDCVVGSAASCAASTGCTKSGRCALKRDDAGRASCVLGAEDCKKLEGCTTWGRCSLVDGECVVGSDADCKPTNRCKTRGICTARGGSCVVGSVDECKTSSDCAEWGRCSLQGDRCVVMTDADCKHTPGCQKQGWCTAKPATGSSKGDCITPPAP